MLSRRQIDAVEHAAGERFRIAYIHVVSGRLKSTLGESAGMPRLVVRGGTLPGELHAAAILNQARSVLGEIDYRVVEVVAGLGCSLGEASVQIFKLDGTRLREHVGHRLRTALRSLGECWFPVRRTTIAGSSHRGADARPADAAVGDREIKVTAVHVSRRGVYGS
jgi:hypothetical protein